jgi:hypothetical protein
MLSTMTAPADPPSDLARLRHFMATVEDYRRLEIAHPLGDGINVFGHRDDDAQRWRVILHGAILRKYFAPKDRLYLVEVVRALRASVPTDSYPEDEWDRWETEITAIRSVTVHQYQDQPSRGEMEILRHELYGRFLHGDYGKWERSEPDFATDSGVFWAVTHQVDRLNQLAGLLGDFEDRGLLVL